METYFFQKKEAYPAYDITAKIQECIHKVIVKSPWSNIQVEFQVDPYDNGVHMNIYGDKEESEEDWEERIIKEILNLSQNLSSKETQVYLESKEQFILDRLLTKYKK